MRLKEIIKYKKYLKKHELENLFMNNIVQSYSWFVHTPIQTAKSKSSAHLFRTVLTPPIKNEHRDLGV